MKFQLPKNIKDYYFFCQDSIEEVNYDRCKKLCPDDYRLCWEEHLRADIALDCQVDNERNARGFVKCSQCGSSCDIGLLFNRFLCSKCDHVEFVEPEEQKALMGDEYIEVDEQELAEKLKKV